MAAVLPTREQRPEAEVVELELPGVAELELEPVAELELEPVSELDHLKA